jgi:outer membrane protein OmpA-like peptidoglycan-associated protein
MRQSYPLIVSASLALLLAACQKEPAAAVDTTTSEPAAAAVPAESATAPVAGTVDAPAAVADTGFSVDKIAISTASLPPFPFFEIPDGLVGKVKDGRNTVDFGRHFFLAGKKMIPVEGRLYHNSMSLITQDKSREYTALEFHRNYENAILALGGAKISETQFTRPIVDEVGGLREVNKSWHSAPPTSGYEHYSYLIRSADKEYWIHVGTSAAGKTGHIVVLEKKAMTQSLGFLDAAAMKTALDADGRVALYINFDTDKSTLWADSQAVIAEIKTLLDSDAGLKVSIEGHTDNTGSADRNRQLSSERARSVLDALVGLGIAPSRLGAKGFGPDKPLADNADEAGRAKNRRVELVKL